MSQSFAAAVISNDAVCLQSPNQIISHIMDLISNDWQSFICMSLIFCNFWTGGRQTKSSPGCKIRRFDFIYLFNSLLNCTMTGGVSILKLVKQVEQLNSPLQKAHHITSCSFSLTFFLFSEVILWSHYSLQKKKKTSYDILASKNICNTVIVYFDLFCSQVRFLSKKDSL